ncbi:trigger factor [Rhodocytophaga rosea]|uniref:Trigger factor n=1 Tax=Rhodocytophaga rosea TaxID=2704465 RepID=A0A6C0GRB7_9BACT|nr:trigger factor [Rhodocytophaga rosea]QHT70040.1 trigger factor [Rhodocytophaga rosea]
MDITLDKQTDTDASIRIKLQEADYQPKVDKKLKEYTQKAQIKGFRPGKVPPSLIKKMYGKGVMVDEINHLLIDAVNNYIKENKLSIVGEPLPDTEKAEEIDWDTQKEFEFSYNVGLVPDFSVDVENLALSAYQVEPNDTELEEMVTSLTRRYGEYTHPDTTAEGDFVYGTLKQVDGSINKENAFLSLSSLKKEALPQFTGVAKDQAITFDIQNVFENDETIRLFTGTTPEEAAALTGNFEFTVTEIDRSEPAELNQEFFDKVLGKDAVQNEEEFKAKLRTLLQENYNQQTGNLLTTQIKDQLLANTDITLPDDFLKRWLKATNDKVTEEVLAKEYDLYVKDLKWSLIKNKIAETNEIKVEHEEVLNKTKDLIKQQFGSMGMGEQADDMLNTYANNFLQAEKGKNYMNIFEQAFNDKVVELVKTKATVASQTVSPDEFKKITKDGVE